MRHLNQKYSPTLNLLPKKYINNRTEQNLWNKPLMPLVDVILLPIVTSQWRDSSTALNTTEATPWPRTKEDRTCHSLFIY